MVKLPLRDSEPTIKIFGKILAVTIFKFKVVVNKKRSHLDEFTFS
jgi:hypothetical protein